jgi:hypothetical protein
VGLLFVGSQQGQKLEILSEKLLKQKAQGV